MKLFKKLSQSGVAHVAVLAVVVVGLAAVGTYELVQSHAQVPPDGGTTYTYTQTTPTNHGGVTAYACRLNGSVIAKYVVSSVNGSYPYLVITYEHGGQVSPVVYAANKSTGTYFHQYTYPSSSFDVAVGASRTRNADASLTRYVVSNLHSCL